MRTTLLLLACVCGYSSYAQQTTTYSHTTESGVRIHSTNTVTTQGQISTEHNSTKAIAIEEYSIDQVLTAISYTESKLEAAQDRNDVMDIERYKNELTRLYTRRDELTKVD